MMNYKACVGVFITCTGGRGLQNVLIKQQDLLDKRATKRTDCEDLQPLTTREVLRLILEMFGHCQQVAASVVSLYLPIAKIGEVAPGISVI
jgi:hypothetical protein